MPFLRQARAARMPGRCQTRVCRGPTTCPVPARCPCCIIKQLASFYECNTHAVDGTAFSPFPEPAVETLPPVDHHHRVAYRRVLRTAQRPRASGRTDDAA